MTRLQILKLLQHHWQYWFQQFLQSNTAGKDASSSGAMRAIESLVMDLVPEKADDFGAFIDEIKAETNK